MAVRPPAGAPRGTAAIGTRLQAPRADARAGETIGGRSFGATTDTGILSGAKRTFTLHAVQGSFVVRLPPATATLLVVGHAS